jgi:hypothetical protein
MGVLCGLHVCSRIDALRSMIAMAVSCEQCLLRSIIFRLVPNINVCILYVFVPRDTKTHMSELSPLIARWFWTL